MANLPVEIIQEIFLKLCSPQTEFPLRRDEPRLVVTQICSQWRAIALSTPTLWANFSIYVRGNSASQLVPIRVWISRSAQSLLSFEFYTLARGSGAVADLVFPVIHRCSFLSLRLNTTTLNRLLALPSNSLCALRSITLFVEEVARVVDPIPFATAFQSCPKLHTFTLATFTFGSRRHLRIADFNVPWHQLTTLRLESSLILAHECLDIVRRCTSLQECRIFVSAMDDLALRRIIGVSRHPVVLPSLHTLHIEFPGWENDNFMFLHALYLPHLRKFQPGLPGLFKFSEWTMDPAPWSLSVLQSVLCDTLQELDLSKFSVYDSLSETLAQMPNLTTLWLNDNSHRYPEIMRALSKGIIAPCLTALHFGFVESSDFVFDILEARVAAARANSGITTLVNVTTLDRDDDPIMINEARLIALVETGMQIRFGRDL